MSVSRAIAIIIDNELVERCDRLRTAGRLKHRSLKRFREMILEMGLDQFERTRLSQPRKTIEDILIPAQPGTAPWSGENIIPFPGVSIDRKVTYQNALDDFLKEMGYIK